jgi:hypothetical protein
MPEHTRAQDVQAYIEARRAAYGPLAPPPREARRSRLSNLSHIVVQEAAGTEPGNEVG